MWVIPPRDTRCSRHWPRVDSRYKRQPHFRLPLSRGHGNAPFSLTFKHNPVCLLPALQSYLLVSADHCHIQECVAPSPSCEFEFCTFDKFSFYTVHLGFIIVVES